jgi:hypothetical protein
VLHGARFSAIAAPHDLLRSAARYGGASLRVLVRTRAGTRSHERAAARRPIFVVGSPRSGTTFLASNLGAQPGLVDLGEVKPLKAAIPSLAQAPTAEAAVQVRRILGRIRRLGLVGSLREVEQTPETAFVLAAALRAYPDARAVHLVRDGRDVVCSLLERGWLSAERSGSDDIGAAYGAHARFWVEPERIDEFRTASDARRAAWAWRRYVSAARSVGERTLELRYETLASDPATAAEQLAEHLGLDRGLLAETLTAAHTRSVGRWLTQLTSEQLADVEREAGPLLRELGY